MSEDHASQDSIRDRLSARGGDAIGDLANALLDNPVFKEALSTAMGAGERAMQAQKAAMGAVGLPSADELERLERRLRSMSDRLESVEDQLDGIARDVSALRGRIDQIPADQASLKVDKG